MSSQHSEQTLRIVQQAAQLHAGGRLAEAEPLYRQALARSPGNFDAVHLYGVLLSQTQRLEQAETYLRRAVHLEPNASRALSNLGNLLRDRGRLEEALPFLRRAVELDPRFAPAYQNLGVVLNALGNTRDAEECFARAVELKPDFPEALNSLGNALRLAEKLPESEGCYRKALSLRPQYAEAHTGLGATLNAMHRKDESLECCRYAVTLRPDSPEVRNNFGLALLAHKSYGPAEAELREAIRLRNDYVDAHHNLGSVLSGARRYDEALRELNHALELKPADGKIWMDVGSVLRSLRRFDEAKHACRRAIELNPESPIEYYNLGVVHLDLCEIEEAIAWFRKAVSVKPSAALPHWGLALALLADGQYQEGWKEYEWRWECSEFYPPRPRFTQPSWDGSDPCGKIILVHCEQGYGDAIQFARYAAALAARGAKVIVQCSQALKKLFGTLPGIAGTHCDSERAPAFDFECALLSLPMLMETTLQTIPANVPYLHADPATTETWRRRLASTSGKLRVGIAWAGNPEHQRDHERSCGIERLSPLSDIRDVALVSLQKGPFSQVTSAPNGMKLLNLTAELDDFADTAALIANLDLVISVDTSIAHLAGAMGKPVWTLLSFAPDWRWLLHREDTPWYPTMRLFRQASPGDWSGAIDRIIAQLSARVAK